MLKRKCSRHFNFILITVIGLLTEEKMSKNEEFNLWHYTTAEGLKGILSDKTLWATDYRFLNDSLELIYSKKILHQTLLPKIISTIEDKYREDPNIKKVVEYNGGIQKIANIEVDDTTDILFNSMLNPPDSPQQIPFILSFCEVSKNDNFKQKNGLLSQWRGYGKDGGYAIIFDLNELISKFVIEKNSFYYGIFNHGKVVYELNKTDISTEIDNELEKIVNYAHRVYISRIFKKELPLPANAEIGALFNCMVFLKHKGFEEEKEYRFCVMPQCKEIQNSPYFEHDENKSFKEIKIRNNEGALVPYIRLFERSESLPIKGICVGPHREKESRIKAIKTYLGDIGLGRLDVFCSDIPYIGSK